MVCQSAESAVNQNYGLAFICRLRAMRQTRHPVVAVGVASLVAGLLAPSAVADSAVPLGGGAGIVVNGTNCTLTTIGHDSGGTLVGFTAATCGGPGSSVDVEGGPSSVGNVVAANDELDYAVIKFDPAKVTPNSSFAGFPINGIGPDPTVFRQPICTQGGATGFGCGAFKFGGPKPGIVAANMPAWQPGDNGAPVTADAHLVGLTRRGDSTPVLGPVPEISTHIGFTLFSAILADVNAKGGPGAGFTPI
jgi:hypothetical protein